MFSTAEISQVLGLEVARATLSNDGPYVVCTWKAKEKAAVPSWRRSDPVTKWSGGIVTIIRGEAGNYADLANRVTALAKSKKATGRHELFRVGDRAFAIGASVSGVPIWHAVAQHDDQAIAVEVSGADSDSSVATVSDFLSWTVARS